MKKLFILMAAACCLTFTACNNKPAEQPAENTEMQAEDHPCCKEMTEEQKAEMEACKKAGEDWQNWENLTDERKAELLDMRKAKYDEMQAMKKAQEEKKAKFEAAMLNWDKLSLDDRKAAFDEMGCCGGCQKGEGPACHKGEGPGCPKGEGCHKEGGKCPNKH